MAYKRNIEELDLESFLHHKGSMGGGAFLKKWKDDGEIVVWLHPRATIIPLWSHTWYRPIKKRDSNDTILVPVRFNSMEPEAILKRRNRRDDKTDEREFPPTICPFSLFLEWLYQEVRAGRINWVDEIFSFDEAAEVLLIHAGGALGMFSQKDDDLTKEEIAELRRARIRRDEAWSENMGPRMQYVFRVVPDMDPSSGCMIALESQTLGDKLKKVIADRMDDFGRTGDPDKGNPFKHPYAFKWVYIEKETFSKKYDCRAMTTAELTQDIQDVFDREPPSIDELCNPSNVKELMQSMQAHWVHKDVVPPWDDIFGLALKELEGTDAVADPTDFAFGANAGDDRPSASDVVDAAGVVEDNEIECDVCQGTMKDDEYTCPQCGTTYDPGTGNILKRGQWPKPQKRTRSGK